MADFFYYWKDYEIDTLSQTKPCYKLHRETDKILEIGRGDTVWCVVSIERGGASKRVALGAKIIAEKSASNPTTHADYRRYGLHYFLDGRIGTEYYDTESQSGLEDMLRNLSFPVNAEHVGGSFQGKNGFRCLTDGDKQLFNEYISALAPHPIIKVNVKK
jgi:hypothetical protein